MYKRTRWLVAVCCTLFLSIAVLFAQAQTESDLSPPGSAVAVSASAMDEIVDRVISREAKQNTILASYHPLIETYGQDAKKIHGEFSVVRDWYLLGVARTQGKLAIDSLLAPKDEPIIKHLDTGFNPPGFLQEAYIDRSGFDRQHYAFRFAGREFLGSVRCLMFDVTPLLKAGKGRFKGRIWVEDENYDIVRFSGAYYPLNQWTFDHLVLPSQWHNPPFDSWRVNVQPGLWLPAYIFTQNLDEHWVLRAQTRLWGYHRQDARHQSEFGSLAVESQTATVDLTVADEDDRTPLEAQRQWRRDAEENALSTLEAAGLIAPSGPVEKILDTVVTNLEVSNGIEIEPKIQCRILTTGNIDIFFIGHTLILSRGLIDVLPNEPTLAAVIAQGMGRIVTTAAVADRYGFGDTMQMPTRYLVHGFRVPENKQALQKADEYALALLKNSPYKDKIASVGIFLNQLHTSSRTLIQLTHPIWGNKVSENPELIGLVLRAAPERPDQITALPIGGRLKLDPWDDRLTLLRTAPSQLASARDQMPFGMTPFMPSLERYQEKQNQEQVPGNGGH